MNIIRARYFHHLLEYIQEQIGLYADRIKLPKPKCQGEQGQVS